MGEPYDASDCPVCGSTNTQSYLASTRRQIGYGSKCLDCGVTWELVNADDETGPGDMAARGHLAATDPPPTAPCDELVQRSRARHS